MATIKVPCRVVVRELVGSKSHLDIIINGNIAAVVEYDLSTGHAEVFDFDPAHGLTPDSLLNRETKPGGSIEVKSGG